mmetsp:Transcript_15588/g.39734  ORF Transcript_15588/g.39734 Transcript_15588/m.39734 type:complete len:83 (-) Transcript_15588:773-1021(-)
MACVLLAGWRHRIHFHHQTQTTRESRNGTLDGPSALVYYVKPSSSQSFWRPELINLAHQLLMCSDLLSFVLVLRQGSRYFLY